MNQQKMLLLSSLLLGIAGCSSSTLHSNGPIVQETNEALYKGFRYYLSKDLLQVSVVKKTKTQKTVNDDLTIPTTVLPSYTISKPNISTLNVKDDSAFYTLDLSLNWMLDSNLKITTTDTGILKSVNGDSKGQAAKVVKNSLDIVASVAAVAGGLGALTDEKVTKIQDAEHINSSPLFINHHQQLMASLGELSNTELKMVVENKSAYLLWENIYNTRTLIHNTQSKIRRTQTSTLTLNDYKKIKDKQKLVELFQNTLAELSKTKKQLELQWNSTFSAFKNRHGLNLVTTTKTYEQLFELNELPDAKAFSSGMSEVGLIMVLSQLRRHSCQHISGTWNSSKQSCDKPDQYQKVAHYYQQSGVLLTAVSNNKLLDYSQITQNIEQTHPDQTLIFYRQKEPMIIKAFVVEKDKSQLVYNAKHDVIKPGPSTAFVVFDENMFANHQMTLTFDGSGNGVLTQLERKTTSAAKGLSSALSSGIESASSKLTKLSGNMVTYQENQRKLDKHDLQLQIDRITSKKTLLDAQIALDAGTTSKETLVEKQRLDNELAKLESEYALSAKQGSFDVELEQSKLTAELNTLNSKLALAKAQGSYDINLQTQLITLQNNMQQLMQTKTNSEQTGTLKTQVQVLTQEISLLKLQQALEELKTVKEKDKAN